MLLLLQNEEKSIEVKNDWLNIVRGKGYILNEQEIEFVLNCLLPAKKEHPELFFNFFSDSDCLVIEETASLKEAVAIEADWHSHIHTTGKWADMKVKHFHSGS